MSRIAVDAMGGDRGPEEVVAGALEARSETVAPVLVGPPDLDTRGLELIAARDVVGNGREAHRRRSHEAGQLARRGVPCGA
jgi:fatty acid/phospholipid biosynthesis enzyme